jgi:hypothetical protein
MKDKLSNFGVGNWSGEFAEKCSFLMNNTPDFTGYV